MIVWYGRALPWAYDTPPFLPPFPGPGFVGLDVDEGVDVGEGVDSGPGCWCWCGCLSGVGVGCRLPVM